MSNFWDNIGAQQNVNNNLTQQNNGFNLQQFLKFYQDSKGQDPNQMLQNLLNSGNYSKEQIENAKNQAGGILQMLQSIGILK